MAVQDNGVKIVDPLGEMLAREWETFANQMANARSASCQQSMLSAHAVFCTHLLKPFY